MKIITLDQELYDYLLHVVTSYTRAGIDPQEGRFAFDLWSRVKQAQEVDIEKLKAQVAQNATPDSSSKSTTDVPDTAGDPLTEIV